MEPMYCDPAFSNGGQWVAPTSDIHYPTPGPVYPGNFSTRELCGMGDAVLADSQCLKQFPVRLNEGCNVPSTSINDELGLFDAYIAARELEVRALDDAIRTNSDATFSWPERNDQDLGPANGPLTDWQGQAPLATGVWSNGAFNTTPDHGMTPGWTTSQEEQGRRVNVTEPGSQIPGVTVNGVALQLPKIKFPSYNQSAMASGVYAQEVLTQKASKAQPKARGTRRNPSGPRGYECTACTLSEGKPITFKTERSLKRHLAKTKRHNAPPVLRCSCGTEVVREDAMYSHRKRKSCGGTIVRL